MLTFGLKSPNNDAHFEDWSLPLREAGYSWMEIRAPETPDPGWEEQLRVWRKRDGWSYSVHAQFFGINLSSPNPRVRRAAVEVALEDLAFAKRIGARRLTLHAGDVNWYDVPPIGHPAHARMIQELNRLREKHLAAAANSITEIAQVAHSQGIEVTVENLYKPWDLLLSPEEVANFLDRLGGSVSFTLDTGHARVAGWPPVSFLHLLNGRVQVLHLHWNDGAFDTHDFPALTIPDVAEVLRTANQRCPQATFLIEIAPSSEEEFERFRSWPAQVRELLKAKF
jgi:sugar phosphate isomerase/epimerase